MRYAIHQGKRKEALGLSGQIGRCECCDADVRGADGKLRQYWSHVTRKDCDTWSEAEGPWHIAWKERFLASQSKDEVAIRESDVAVGHRADILTPHRVVVELQHSYLAVEDIQARERFYGNNTSGMIWLFDQSDLPDNFVLTKEETHWIFQWKRMRETVLYCHFPRFIDLGNDQVFEIKKLDKGEVVKGWGKLHTYDEFVQLAERLSRVSPNPEQTRIRSPKTHADRRQTREPRTAPESRPAKTAPHSVSTLAPARPPSAPAQPARPPSAPAQSASTPTRPSVTPTPQPKLPPPPPSPSKLWMNWPTIFFLVVVILVIVFTWGIIHWR